MLNDTIETFTYSNLLARDNLETKNLVIFLERICMFSNNLNFGVF